jgi:transcriptional regulator with XRE-family HTH domain
MTVSERLRAIRQALKMTQVEFAQAIHVSDGYVAELENNHRVANPRILRLVALTFGVSETWLQTGEGGMFIRTPEEKIQRIMAIFDNLRPEFQDFALKQLDQLLALQKYDGEDGDKSENGA